jgi:hypothetical protein
VSQDKLRESQARNRAILYYVLGLLAAIAAILEITQRLGG